MQIYGWGCSNGWNSIILRGFTASQINCHYKNPSAFAGFSISASSAHNVQNHSNIGDNCVCDKWSSVQRPVSTAGYDTLPLLLRVPSPLESTVLILLFFSCYVCRWNYLARFQSLSVARFAAALCPPSKGRSDEETPRQGRERCYATTDNRSSDSSRRFTVYNLQCRIQTTVRMECGQGEL